MQMHSFICRFKMIRVTMQDQAHQHADWKMQLSSCLSFEACLSKAVFQIML